MSAGMLGPCRWAVDENEATGEDQSAQRDLSKRSKLGKQPAHSGLKQEDDQGQAGESFDGLTASLDGLIDPKSGKGKSGPASHATSKVSAPNLLQVLLAPKDSLPPFSWCRCS